MSLLVYFTLGFLIGILIIIGIPVMIGPHLPEQYRQGAARWFINLQQTWFGRGVIGATKTGAYYLKPTTYDHVLEADRTTVGDTKHDYQDPNGLQGWLANRPFMCVFGGRNVGFSPREPDIADRNYRRVQDDHHKTTVDVQLQTDGGTPESQRVTAFSEAIAIPRRKHAVDLRAARHAFDGSCPPDAAEQTDDLVEKSQAGFNSKQLIEGMFIIMCLGVGAGIVYIGKSQFSGGGGGLPDGSNFGLMLVPDALFQTLGVMV